MLTLILGLFRRKSPPKSLLEVAFQGELEAVRQKVLAGAHVEERGPQGATALMLACQEGHTAVARELLAAEDGNARNTLGVTPMGLAAFGGHEETLRALLRQRHAPTVRGEVQVLVAPSQVIDGTRPAGSIDPDQRESRRR